MPVWPLPGRLWSISAWPAVEHAPAPTLGKTTPGHKLACVASAWPAVEHAPPQNPPCPPPVQGCCDVARFACLPAWPAPAGSWACVAAPGAQRSRGRTAGRQQATRDVAMERGWTGSWACAALSKAVGELWAGRQQGMAMERGWTDLWACMASPDSRPHVGELRAADGRERESLQSESQTPTRGQTDATRRQAKGGRRRGKVKGREAEASQEVRRESGGTPQKHIVGASGWPSRGWSELAMMLGQQSWMSLLPRCGRSVGLPNGRAQAAGRRSIWWGSASRSAVSARCTGMYLRLWWPITIGA